MTSEEYAAANTCTHSKMKKTSHSPAKTEVLTALLLNVPVFWGVAPY
jgi:hypothetical protein